MRTNVVQTAEETAARLRTMLPMAAVRVSSDDPVHIRVTLPNEFSFNLPCDFNAEHVDYVVAAVLAAMNFETPSRLGKIH